jgi:RNA polymerase sigma factor (TIGR02999 family)
VPQPPELPIEDQHDLTVLLQRMHRGDREAGEKAATLVYDQLHRIASRELRGEHPGHLLQTTALIHEAYLRLTGSEKVAIESRQHFFAIASQQMRRILIEHARADHAQKRGGGAVYVGLDDVQAGVEPRGIDLLLLDEALRELQQFDPRAAQVIEMRYFGGYTDSEVAQALDTSLATVRRDWEFARSWLFDRMYGGAG